MVKRQQTLYSVQVLRAVAASMVVLFHSQPSEWSLGSERQSTLDFLNSGVDIFFVLSGLVMCLTAQSKRSGVEFLKARLIRIVPIYWIGTLAMIVLLAILGQAPEVREVAMSLLFIPYGDPNGDMHPVLGVGWTLTYEMFFYLIFAVTLWLGRKQQVITIAALFAVLVILRPILENVGAIGVRLSSPLLFEFVFGIVIGLLLPYIKMLSWIGLISCICGFLLIPCIAILPISLPRAIHYGIPAAIIVAGAVGAESIFRSKFWRPFLILGDASYSIYLFHVFIVIAAQNFLNQENSNTYVLLTFSCSLIFGVVVYMLVERPMLSSFRKLMAARRLAAVAS